jgi:hypothetical protein
MLSEVFFEPALFDDPHDASSSLHWHAVGHYLRECLEGALLFGSVRKYEFLKEILKRIRVTASDDTYLRLKGLIVDMRDRGRLVIRPSEGSELAPKKDADWLEEARLSDTRWPFGCFLFRQAHVEATCPLHGSAGRCRCYAELGGLVPGGGRGVRTAPRGTTSLREHLGPLLGVSRMVTIIDYCAANPGSANRFTEGIGTCLEEWVADTRVPKREFAVSSLWQGDGWKDELPIWKRMAKAAIGTRAGAAVILRLHSDSNCHEKFPKNRFLLTEVDGAEVGKGFDKPKPREHSINTFGLVDFGDRIELLRKMRNYFPIEEEIDLLA